MLQAEIKRMRYSSKFRRTYQRNSQILQPDLSPIERIFQTAIFTGNSSHPEILALIEIDSVSWQKVETLHKIARSN
jgi:hypothetical protein